MDLRGDKGRRQGLNDDLEVTKGTRQASALAATLEQDEKRSTQAAVARIETRFRLVSIGSGLNSLAELVGRGLPRSGAGREAYTGLVSKVATRLRASIVLYSFIAAVLVPAAVATLYLVFIASDQFVAETRFAVRAADDNSERSRLPNMLQSLGSGGGAPTFASQDAEIVSSYIRSRAVIEDLGNVVDLRMIFRRPEADFWARLSDDASSEDLRDYWMRMITTYVETASGIVTVRARAFRRDDALTLAKAILQASEHLVNSISLRARSDAMRRAEDEVRRADGQMRLALADLAHFRDTEGIIDPVKSAEFSGKILLQLMQDKIKIETELFISRRSTGADAPGVASLRARLESVDGQIARTRAELTGSDPRAHNLAASLARFEELEVKRQFAEAMYSFARDGVDRARVAAEKQTVYVTVFVPPALPEDMSYPLRFTFSALIAVGLMIAWATIAMIWASIMDHRL